MVGITLEEIKEFLRNKPGYMKEGGKRLRKVLQRRGLTTTVATCKVALTSVREELKIKPVLSSNKSPKVLFYDIETSYGTAKIWSPGYNMTVRYDQMLTLPKIICVSYKWQGDDTVETLQWDSKHDDKELVKNLIEVINEADFTVAHNGDRFDLGIVRARAVAHGLSMHPKYVTVDTLKIARSNFKFPSNSLDSLADYLGLEGKIKTSMKLWDDVIAGDIQALEDMIAYCEQDVHVLEKVYDKLTQMTLPRIHVGALHGKTKQTSPYSGGKNIELVKTTTTRAGTTKRLMKDLDNGKYFEMSNTNYKKFIEINK